MNERTKTSKPRQSGVTKGICHKCKKPFSLKRHTKHSRTNTVKSGICGKCEE